MTDDGNYLRWELIFQSTKIRVCLVLDFEYYF